MHISEGVLSAPVLIAGGVIAAGGLAAGLKRLEYERIPQVALLSSAFFVASLIHVPVGPSSVHLVLNGLVGLLLGWAAFPAIFVGLTLQALLFQFGGITTLGINTANIVLPAVAGYYLFSRTCLSRSSYVAFGTAFACGFLAILLSALLIAVSLMTTGEHFIEAAWTIVAAHVPVMIIEGVLTLFLVGVLRKTKPEMLGSLYVPKKTN